MNQLTKMTVREIRQQQARGAKITRRQKRVTKKDLAMIIDQDCKFLVNWNDEGNVLHIDLVRGVDRNWTNSLNY